MKRLIFVSIGFALAYGFIWTGTLLNDKKLADLFYIVGLIMLAHLWTSACNRSQEYYSWYFARSLALVGLTAIAWLGIEILRDLPVVCILLYVVGWIMLLLTCALLFIAWFRRTNLRLIDMPDPAK